MKKQGVISISFDLSDDIENKLYFQLESMFKVKRDIIVIDAISKTFNKKDLQSNNDMLLSCVNNLSGLLVKNISPKYSIPPTNNPLFNQVPVIPLDIPIQPTIQPTIQPVVQPPSDNENNEGFINKDIDISNIDINLDKVKREKIEYDVVLKNMYDNAEK